MKNILNFLAILITLTSNLYSQNRIELGEVNWIRNYDDALLKAHKESKPIFILFQEVPGCATCQNYGKNVLSDPFIVEAIENEFIPLAIFNNKGGHDKEVLKKYNEPTWNNPVVRIVDSKGKDIIKRVAGNYTAESLIINMILALKTAGFPTPKYLDTYNKELISSFNGTKEAYFSMYCFWSGEASLGQQTGVMATVPGFMNGKEVVKVLYNPEETNAKNLFKEVKKENITLEESQSKFRKDKDPQYYLKNSYFKYLALSPLQKTMINSELYKGKNPTNLLSPTQSEYLKLIESKDLKKPEVLYDSDFKKSWSVMKRTIK